MPQGHYMKKSLGRVKKGNDKGKFKLEVTKVIKYEASESTGNLLREVATETIERKNRLDFKKPGHSHKDKVTVTHRLSALSSTCLCLNLAGPFRGKSLNSGVIETRGLNPVHHLLAM